MILYNKGLNVDFNSGPLHTMGGQNYITMKVSP